MPCCDCVDKRCWKIGNIICGIVGIVFGYLSAILILLYIVGLYDYACHQKCREHAAILIILLIPMIAHGIASVIFLMGIAYNDRSMMVPFLVTGILCSLIPMSVGILLCTLWVIFAWCNGGVPESRSGGGGRGLTDEGNV
ncbi:unnamed protein product [Cyprideis torosa]|uniref:Uncharacterized protein n=1 Tax=Cyprideis torosa TaxID=163714 RepID=A0A7R8WPU6_9CRUS|nr:unnamed protein product [Cyprideis torosa]CAG0901148.1 unnamed protein product [Cyprideis torosa]